MRKIFILIIAMCLLLCSCGTQMQSVDNVTDSSSSKYSMFIVIENSESSSGFKVVYHRDTKVMYTVSCGMYNSGNFTVMLNPDGTPMTYEEAP